jgi:hypothetical protein
MQKQLCMQPASPAAAQSWEPTRVLAFLQKSPSLADFYTTERCTVLLETRLAQRTLDKSVFAMRLSLPPCARLLRRAPRTRTDPSRGSASIYY